MALGPGKYDDVCSMARERVGLGGSEEIESDAGGGVLLVVIGGNRGNGFACQADLETTLMLPDFLEHVAREIRKHGPFGKS